jgi:hypothetical protein
VTTTKRDNIVNSAENNNQNPLKVGETGRKKERLRKIIIGLVVEKSLPVN